MSTYYVSIMQRCLISGDITEGCGSFNNFTIDGRLSLDNAISVARKEAEDECSFKNREYVGFKIKKGNRWECLDNAKVML